VQAARSAKIYKLSAISERYTEILWFVSVDALANAAHSVIPAKAGIQNRLEILDSGSRFACPE
jgi:hypothetical protein